MFAGHVGQVCSAQQTVRLQESVLPESMCASVQFLRLQRKEAQVRIGERGSAHPPQEAGSMAQGGPVDLRYLKQVPAAPLQTVLDAWVHLNATWGPSDTQTANAALESRLEELWASQPEAAARCLELEPSEGSREAKLAEALSRYARVLHGPNFGAAASGGSWGIPPRFDARCEGLAGRLITAEAKAGEAKRRRLEESASSASRELQAAKEEIAGHQQREEELTVRVAELEAAASEKSVELQAVHEERARLADRLGEAESEVQAAQDEAVKHKEQQQQLEARVLALEAEKAAQLQASKEERRQLAERFAAAEAEICQQTVKSEQLVRKVATSEAVATESQAELRKVHELLSRLQAEGCHRSSAEDQAGRNVNVQSMLLENAVYKDRCEQLKVETSAKMDRIQILSEDLGRYKERCDQLQQQLTEAKKPAGCLSVSGRPLVHPSHERSSPCSEESWVHLSDAGCFMADASFKDENGVLIPIKDLREGSRIMAADGTVVAIATPPEQQQAMGHTKYRIHSIHAPEIKSHKSTRNILHISLFLHERIIPNLCLAMILSTGQQDRAAASRHRHAAGHAGPPRGPPGWQRRASVRKS